MRQQIQESFKEKVSTIINVRLFSFLLGTLCRGNSKTVIFNFNYTVIRSQEAAIRSRYD